MRAAWSYVRGRVDSWYFGYAVAAVFVDAFVPMFMPVSVRAVYPDNAVTAVGFAFSENLVTLIASSFLAGLAGP